MFIANLSNLPDNVTQSDIDAYYGDGAEVSVDEFIKSVKNGDGWCINSAPDAVQAMYRSWCEDDHYPLSPVNKDDHEELWDKFLESLTTHKQPGFVIGDGSQYGRIAGKVTA